MQKYKSTLMLTLIHQDMVGLLEPVSNYMVGLLD